jgi:hypothetical protein
MPAEPPPPPAEPDGTTDGDGPVDPVLVRRRQMARGAHLGKRTGYLLWTAAVVLFFVALATGLPRALTTAILLCMGVGSVFLAPAIVIGYGVKAADREDAEQRAARS